jgi:hypothetical protein
MEGYWSKERQSAVRSDGTLLLRLAYSVVGVMFLICLSRVSRLQSPGVWLGG